MGVSYILAAKGQDLNLTQALSTNISLGKSIKLHNVFSSKKKKIRIVGIFKGVKVP